ncbi:hypothetical protein [Nocardia rhamnosiphila]
MSRSHRPRSGGVADFVADSFLAEDLEQALNELDLNPAQRHVIKQFYIEGRTAEDIAGDAIARTAGYSAYWIPILLRRDWIDRRKLKSGVGLAAYLGDEVAPNARLCEVCGTALEIAETGRPKKYCDWTCRKRAHRAQITSRSG